MFRTVKSAMNCGARIFNLLIFINLYFSYITHSLSLPSPGERCFGVNAEAAEDSLPIMAVIDDY